MAHAAPITTVTNYSVKGADGSCSNKWQSETINITV